MVVLLDFVTKTCVMRGREQGDPAHSAGMAKYILNDKAFEHAKRLIDGRQYVLRSDTNGSSAPGGLRI